MVGSLCHCLESVFCIHFLYLLQLDNKIAFRIFFSSSKRCRSSGSWTFLHVVHYATKTVFLFLSSAFANSNGRFIFSYKKMALDTNQNVSYRMPNNQDTSRHFHFTIAKYGVQQRFTVETINEKPNSSCAQLFCGRLIEFWGPKTRNNC